MPIDRLIVTGNGTSVGKTIVSAILATLFKADYWKPVQSGLGNDLDTEVIKGWLDAAQHFIHPPAYSFQRPISPHAAAKYEDIMIDPSSLQVPSCQKTLIIETAGGPLVPLTEKDTNLDVFANWKGFWIIVSRHYLGSINHTLMTVEVLKQRGVNILGIIFNGDPNPDSESAILSLSGLKCLGRLLLESSIQKQMMHDYAERWRPCFSHLL